MGLLERLLNGAAAAAGRHARVEGRRVRLSDAAFCGGVGRLAAARAPRLDLRLEPAPAGYRARVNAGGPLEALIVLERLRFEGGILRIELTTPEGVSLASRPAVGAFAAVVGSLFGGTWAGGKLLSLGLPESLRWDGRRATLEVPIDRETPLGRRLAAVEASAAVTHEAGALVLELDRDGVAGDVAGALIGAALERILPFPRSSGA